MPSLTRAQSREIDRIAIDDWHLPGIVLMENAARGITDVAARLLRASHLPQNAISIVCGPGNNGGDGFAVARHLLNRGCAVSVHLLADPAGYSEGGDSAVNLAVLRRMNASLRTDLSLHDAGLVIDALFGTGLDRDLQEPYSGAVRAINAAQVPVLAVDIPSGLDADTGFLHGVAVKADCTATMVAPKRGFTCGEGPHHCGRIEIIDIGVPRAIVDSVLGENTVDEG